MRGGDVLTPESGHPVPRHQRRDAAPTAAPVHTRE
jgi:hypothetical protein